MAMLKGGTKSAVNPQVIGQIKERDEFIAQDLINLERKTGLPQFAFEELDRTEKKKIIKILQRRGKIDSTMFGGEDFDKKDALSFAEDVNKLKKKGFKIVATLEGPDGQEIDIYGK